MRGICHCPHCQKSLVQVSQKVKRIWDTKVPTMIMLAPELGTHCKLRRRCVLHEDVAKQFTEQKVEDCLHYHKLQNSAGGRNQERSAEVKNEGGTGRLQKTQ